MAPLFEDGRANMRYFWTDGIAPFPDMPLQGEIETEVCVIGGGAAGVLIAHEMRRRGADCVLLEAREPCLGVTRATTAVLTAQHDTLYSDLARTCGRSHAAGVLQANIAAVERLRNLAEQIDCDLEVRPSVMYSRTGRDGLEREANFLQSVGFRARYTTSPQLPFAATDAVIYPDMAQFHPLKFLRALAADLRVYTNSFVRRLDGRIALTEHGSVKAETIVVATHFPFINRHGFFFAKQYQKRSDVIAYTNVRDIGLTAVDAGNGFYLRSDKDTLLVGGGDRRTGSRGSAFCEIDSFVKAHFPSAREMCRWSGQDCVTLDGMPYIGRYSPAMPHVWVATGFGFWGMTNAMIAAEILADAAEGKRNRYADLFSPQRRMPLPALLSNLGTSLANYMIPTTRRCPHMGCALRYNRAEHSWDCPCHGSRFDLAGHLIDNPAMKDAKVKRRLKDSDHA